MLAGLSELADRFSTFMREPMYNLGNSITDYIYTPSKRNESSMDDFISKVNNTSDPDVLEEVWLVLAKAFDSGKNEYILDALNIADSLIKNCGARFHNSCTPLFMRRLKEMIIKKASLGGAENMKVMNSAKLIIRDWADAFMPYASQGRGKTIVEGYQDMQRSGIHFPSSVEKPKWTPMITPTPPKREEKAEFDIKAFYRQAKRLQEKLDEMGLEFFENAKAKEIAEECKTELPRIQLMLKRAEAGEEDENYCSHVRMLISLCNKIVKEFDEFCSTPWSDEDDDWNWDSDGNGNREVRNEPESKPEHREEFSLYADYDFEF